MIYACKILSELRFPLTHFGYMDLAQLHLQTYMAKRNDCSRCMCTHCVILLHDCYNDAGPCCAAHCAI